SIREEKARPSPATTTTPAFGSVAATPTAAARSATSWGSSAFSIAGRARVIHPTPSTVSYRTRVPSSSTGPTLAWPPETARRGTGGGAASPQTAAPHLPPLGGAHPTPPPPPPPPP